MRSNMIFYGWKGSLPGREGLSASHFEDFNNYLAGLQKGGLIESFEPFFLNPNGSGITGFVLIRGEEAKLAQVVSSPAFNDHIIRSTMHLQDPLLTHGVSGPLLQDRFARWMAFIPA